MIAKYKFRQVTGKPVVLIDEFCGEDKKEKEDEKEKEKEKGKEKGNHNYFAIVKNINSNCKQETYFDEKEEETVLEMQVGCDQDINTFNGKIFIENYCRVMNLDPSQIEIISVKSGSVCVEFRVYDIKRKTNF